MKYLIFSDLHANYFGLKRILDFAAENKIDHIYCLGDVVGYHSYARECIALLQEHSIPTLKGNHEALLLNEIGGFEKISVRARHSLSLTGNILTNDEKQYLADLPFSLSLDEQAEMVHANFNNLTQTLNTAEKVLPQFQIAKDRNLRLVFHGHTHRPGIFSANAALEQITYRDHQAPVQLKADHFYLINPGSAGESRHNLPLSFIIYNASEQRICFETFRLNKSEEKELQKHNKEIFGGFNLSRFLARQKENTRRFYYSLSKK